MKPFSVRSYLDLKTVLVECDLEDEAKLFASQKNRDAKDAGEPTCFIACDNSFLASDR